MIPLGYGSKAENLKRQGVDVKKIPNRSAGTKVLTHIHIVVKTNANFLLLSKGVFQVTDQQDTRY
jgi:hypothetical protein